MTGYWIINILLSIWVIYDGYQRKHPKKWLYFLGAILLSWLVIPFYLAGRPLKEGEVREGGYAWNVLSSFAIIWTIVMVFAGFGGLIEASSTVQQAQTEAEKAGASIGMMMGLMLIAVIWFFPMFGAVAIGFFVKNNAEVEKGPTGPLADKVSSSDIEKEIEAKKSNSYCPECGESISQDASFCQNCGAEIS